MGGLVIETVRPGVQFTPDAAAAFRRAEAQVRAEFNRDIDSNSTYRDWDVQLRMHNAWIAYVNGRGPYPGHSKALHPNDPLAFHTKGTAVDSDDWRNARIVQILAENGFIRNRLYVPNENHHFEWLRSSDQNFGKPIPGTASVPTAPAPKEDDDMLMIEIKVGSRTHKCALGNGTFRHFVQGDPYEHLKNLWRFDDQWQPLDISQLPAALRTAGCDLHIWDVRNGEFVVLDPLDGSVKSGNVWTAVNAARSGIEQIKVTSADTAAYVAELAS